MTITNTPAADTPAADTPAADNGVNVEALLGAREAMTATPAAAAFVWKASAEWVNGTHTRTSVENFFGIGEEQSHTQEFVLDTDHPEQFAASDEGITPAEMMLVGLAGCLTGGIASVAQNRGIQLRSVRASIEGDHDLRGILGASREARNGFNGIRVAYEIDADATAEEIDGLVAQSVKRSAVYDLFTNGTTVAVEVAS